MQARHAYCYVLVLLSFTCHAQIATESRHVVVVTLDGFRWQEVFQGADTRITRKLNNAEAKQAVMPYVDGKDYARRERLLPFLWNTIATQGQLYGNRTVGCRLSCSNPYWFSYPGYHELLVGAVDKTVCTNARIRNPNSTVLEFLSGQPGYSGAVAAFATWDVFPYILRAPTSGIIINPFPAKTDTVQLPPNDSLTFYNAFDYLRRNKPDVLYIALDETDEAAHHNRYDQYLMAAHRADNWLAKLWKWIQSDPGYRNRTTLLITTDHGRGQLPGKSWRHHGRFTPGSNQIWMAVIGPDTPATGEVRNSAQLYQKQIAGTIAGFLGLDYKNKFEVGKPISTVMRPASLFADKDQSRVNIALLPLK